MSNFDVICCPDVNYATHCGVMLTSLFENNKSHKINVYILCVSLPNDIIDRFRRLVEIYGHKLSVINIDETLFINCPIPPKRHITISTYYRFIIADVLPKDLNRVLYLDCDLIVLNDISEFFEQDISNVGIGAVNDIACYHLDVFNRLEYSSELSYFNSGVLLINLDYWRSNNLSGLLFDYVNNNQDKILFHDQDALNVIFKNDKIMLPLRFNMQSQFLKKANIDLLQNKSEIIENINNILVVHFTGGNKPWYRWSQHPFKAEYLEYKEKSLWNNVPLIMPKRRRLLNCITRWINNLFSKLGLCSADVEYIDISKR